MKGITSAIGLILLIIFCSFSTCYPQAPNAGARVVVGTAPVRANSFYLTRTGKATLVTGKSIEGMFFYSSPPWGEDFFFFYPSGIKTREKILVTQVSMVSFSTVAGDEYAYILEGNSLIRAKKDGSVEKLTTKILMAIDQTPEVNKINN